MSLPYSNKNATTSSKMMQNEKKTTQKPQPASDFWPLLSQMTPIKKGDIIDVIRLLVRTFIKICHYHNITKTPQLRSQMTPIGTKPQRYQVTREKKDLIDDITLLERTFTKILNNNLHKQERNTSIAPTSSLPWSNKPTTTMFPLDVNLSQKLTQQNQNTSVTNNFTSMKWQTHNNNVTTWRQPSNF